jgi:hypothetical protein
VLNLPTVYLIPFPLLYSVHQGDVLSPNLFKIFINDLENSLGDSCSPVYLNNLKIPVFYMQMILFFSLSLQMVFKMPSWPETILLLMVGLTQCQYKKK